MSQKQRRVITPSQTVGPFFSFCLTPALSVHKPLATNVLSEGASGARVVVTGTVFDGDSQPVTDALIEIWQADASGCYRGADGDAPPGAFTGFGRATCDAQGRYRIETVKPGAVPAPEGGLQAPHLALGIFARGLNRRLYTRVYFDDEASNLTDLVLSMVPAARRSTLIARREGNAEQYRFDIRLQGKGETVFLEA